MFPSILQVVAPRWNATERALLVPRGTRPFVWIGIDQPAAPHGLGANLTGLAISTERRIHARTLDDLRVHELDWHLGSTGIIAMRSDAPDLAMSMDEAGLDHVDVIETSSRAGIRAIVTYLKHADTDRRPRFLRIRRRLETDGLRGYDRVAGTLTHTLRRDTGAST